MIRFQTPTKKLINNAASQVFGDWTTCLEQSRFQTACCRLDGDSFYTHLKHLNAVFIHWDLAGSNSEKALYKSL